MCSNSPYGKAKGQDADSGWQIVGGTLAGLAGLAH